MEARPGAVPGLRGRVPAAAHCPCFVVPSLSRADVGLPRRLRVADGALRLRRGRSRCAARARTTSRLRLRPPLAFVALSPLLLGSVILTRFDLWPAMLAALRARRARAGRYRLGARPARRGDRGEAVSRSCSSRSPSRTSGGVAAGERGSSAAASSRSASPLLAYLPFAVLAPGRECVRSVGRQLVAAAADREPRLGGRCSRPRLVGTGVEVGSSHGSQNLVGTAPTRSRSRSRSLQVAVLAWLWLRFARVEGAASPVELAVNAAAALTAFVALGKVLSPQFLIWLVPVVVARPAARARTPGARRRARPDAALVPVPLLGSTCASSTRASRGWCSRGTWSCSRCWRRSSARSGNAARGSSRSS